MVKKLRVRFTLTAALILLVVLVVIGVVINVMNYYNFIASTEKTMSVIAANNGEFPDYEDYLKIVEEERLREEREEQMKNAETAESALPEEENAEEAGTASASAGEDSEEAVADMTDESEQTPATSEETFEDTTETEETEPEETVDPLLEKFEYTAGFGFGLKVTAETAYETRYFYVRFTPDSSMIGYDLSHIAEVTKEEAESLGRTILKQKNKLGTYGNYRYYMHNTEGGATEIIFLNCATQQRSVNFILYISIFTLIAVLAGVTVAVWFMSKKIVKPFVDNLEKQKKFITDAGHELKTPLSIIDANAEVLKLTEGDNEWVDSIQNQTARLGSLVKKLVALSRSEEGLAEFQTERFSISDAAAETVSPFMILAEKNDLSLTSDIDPGIMFDGNEGSIRQLFGTLLENAIKYTPRGGEIKVSLKDRGKIVFEIYNDCEEIDTEKIPSYFDRFFRADDSRSRETGGYGIGLSIAKAIVDKHRGRITASSRDGKSIAFTVTL